ncbi:[protein-PII] uridylyltransferase [Paralimibaculum aggregatum]|uniref:Bifunctional uridylyltransferase/uridylyl-removing enzyme n=1 Tax=Paralimibaculum aggregatum TaxID=3036245 RepID=A0ABQ6LLX5_9RHOB|nr:[protein-PII] uridylyltransferase [Limibaculum sp. NKW23]GMG84195.1 [protein-PII] uridylyltransferase [Limibaculum sp. NKW23]
MNHAPEAFAAGIDKRDMATRTAAGLAHLVAPAETLADGPAVIAEIDRLAGAHPEPDALRPAVLALLSETLATGRERVRAALLAHPAAGLRVARSYAHVTDVVVQGAVHVCQRWLHDAPIRTTGEHLAVVAVGGYGRGEMAAFSDVDLLFLFPYKATAWSESVVESTLYLLWDLRLKVGQSVRSVADCMRYAREDLTIRTSLLEMRFIAGDRGPYETLEEKLWDDLFSRTGAEFVEAKLAERDGRHERHGGSRYLLEPNIKEGKGGLRDLQTLHWVSKYLHRCETAWDLVSRGIFLREEVQRFADASKFIWAVRCHLHDLAGRAQDQLTFDRQVEIAERMGFAESNGRQAVEHFMHCYFRHAKNVGDLTRIFSAALEAQHAKKPPRLSLLLRSLSFAPDAGVQGPFRISEGRLTVRDDEVFAEDPVNLLRLFHEAARLDARIHPQAMRLVTQNLDLIDEAMRQDPEANRIFLEMLTDRLHSEWLLRLLNETDVLGRFLPEFGRIVAMMQFNMYHHYTVDEHIIRCIGVLNEIDRLEAREAHPVASEILKAKLNRRVLYVALLLHDIGKGTRQDHSELGAEIAAQVCPRLGLTEAETETVVWLVRHHLLMSDTAQKRDIADPVTVRDFANLVQSPERLRLLLVLTVCDIRGVGPNVWNNWKAQLLRSLYWETRDLLTGSFDVRSRQHRIDEARAAVAEALSDWTPEARERELGRHYPHYWLGLDTETQRIFAEMAREPAEPPIKSRLMADESRDATKACLYMADHPGIFSRMAGAFALAGADVKDARTYTTSDGMACSTFWIQDDEGHPFDPMRFDRLKRHIDRILGGKLVAREAIREKERVRPRELSFTVPTRIHFDNDGSELYTIIEVNARDRLGLLHALTRTLAALNLNIFSAIIATYGEHAVDVFYVKDLFGLKIRGEAKQRLIEERLAAAIEAIDPEHGGQGASPARRGR